jgi:hypothetical protein
MKTLNKMIGCLVIAGTIISTGVVALAAETKTSTVTKNTQSARSITGKMMKDKGNDRFLATSIENELKTLVSAGTITQAEADSIVALSKEKAAASKAEVDKIKNMTDAERKAYFESIKAQNGGKKGDIFAQAVSSGILTQEKADTAKAKLSETRAAERKAKTTEALSGLVTAGTITQEQSNKILTYIDTLKSNKATSGTTAAGTQKSEKNNALSSLVEDGTLTQAQLDAVSKVLTMGEGRGHGGHKSFGSNKSPKATTNTTTSAATN